MKKKKKIQNEFQIIEFVDLTVPSFLWFGNFFIEHFLFVLRNLIAIHVVSREKFPVKGRNVNFSMFITA